MKEIKDVINEVHQTAKDKGWYDSDVSFGEVIALIHSELSEALEEYRSSDILKQHGVNPLYQVFTDDEVFHRVVDHLPIETQKPCGIFSELADVIIRVFDYVGSTAEVDLFIIALKEKIEYNKTRPYRHGNKKL